jgi:hypothetical protein
VKGAAVKIICHKPKSKWHSPTFTIRGINREELGLILNFAEEGLEAHQKATADKPGEPTRPFPYTATLDLVRKIDAWVHNEDSVVRMTPLEVE